MKVILKYLSILLIKHLQRRYKTLSFKWKYNQSNSHLNKLKLIQNVLFYFKGEFHAWGYFHPNCSWSKEDEIFYNKLFPQKDFEELEIVVWYNPKAITYYQNKIFTLSKGATPDYAREIEKQLIKWEQWN